VRSRPRGGALHAARLTILAVALLAARDATAQRAGPRPLVRADVVLARATAVQGALGLTLPLGNYVRLDGVAGAGVERSAGASGASARGDLVGRFLLDPFRQSRWSGYAGAGLSALRSEGDWRGYLLAVIGVEGPGAHGVLPALELGLGGGARVGVVLRSAASDRR
jgi:hypothetical protein